MRQDSADMRRRFKKLEQMTKFSGLPAATDLKSPFNKGQEKLPPRLTMKGISIAVRVLGHEIRDFTQRTTGKDLVALCRTGRPVIFEKLTNMKLTFDTQGIANILRTARFDGFYLDRTNFVANLGSLSSSYCEDFFTHDDILTSALARRLFIRPTYTSQDCKSRDVFLDSAHGASVDFYQNSRVRRTTEKLRFRERFQIFPNKSLLDYKSSAFKGGSEFSEKHEWKTFVKQSNWSAERKLLNSNGLYVYRIQGSYDDISAYSFYETQVDIGYRQSWDRYAVQLSKIGEPTASSDVIHWVTKCPYPMKSREYVFQRKFGILPEENAVVIVSRATTHDDVPERSDLVRVNTYGSEMIIKPYSDFHENGFAFSLTYFDDPQSNLPNYILDMIAKTGISELMNKVHAAAREHQENQKDVVREEAFDRSYCR